jgi:hypothetical protein
LGFKVINDFQLETDTDLPDSECYDGEPKQLRLLGTIKRKEKRETFRYPGGMSPRNMIVGLKEMIWNMYWDPKYYGEIYRR